MGCTGTWPCARAAGMGARTNNPATRATAPGAGRNDDIDPILSGAPTEDQIGNWAALLKLDHARASANIAAPWLHLVLRGRWRWGRRPARRCGRCSRSVAARPWWGSAWADP